MADTYVSFDVFGWLGYELVIETTVKTRLVFGLVDNSKTRIVWYQFSANMGPGNLNKQNKSDLFSMAQFDYDDGKKPRPKPLVFGVSSVELLASNISPGKTDLALLGPTFNSIRPGTFATLDIKDHGRMTRCWVYIDVKPQGLNFYCDLATKAKRRGIDIMRNGFVNLWSVEKFSQRSLETGPGPVPGQDLFGVLL